MWNLYNDSLSYVDILSGTLFIHRNLHDGGRFEKYRLSSRLGAALPVGVDSYLVLIQEGIFHFKPPAYLRAVAPYPVASKGLRPNDAKIGPDGALWFSLMAENHASKQGSLWKFNGEKHTLVLDGLTIPNGLDWLGDTFFFVDGPLGQIRRFAHRAGQIVSELPPLSATKTPDGLTFDRGGHLWVASWGAGQISEIDVNSEDGLSLSHQLPLEFPTSIAITGGKRSQRFVTAACSACFSPKRKEVPHQHSGAVLVFASETAGRAPYSLNFPLKRQVS